jgi:hypothetical protein
MGILATARRWWSDRAEARTYEALGRDGREALARDVGIQEEILDRIVARGSRAGEELKRLLKAVYLDPQELRRTRPNAMRQMQTTCAACSVAKQCRRDLDRGVARVAYGTYCPNAELITALQRRSWWRDAVRIGS